MHPARLIPIKELRDRLAKACEAGFVKEVRGGNGLALYCYTQSCAYEKAWDDTTKICRGLIVDWTTEKILATPFPKFFNLGEHPSEFLESLPKDFETHEKLDGSLIIIFHYDGGWRCATKGSFNSLQAKWAERWIQSNGVTDYLDPGTTYLAEAIYPENRIVVSYDRPQMVLLTAFDEDGEEWPFQDIADLAYLIDGLFAKEEVCHCGQTESSRSWPCTHGVCDFHRPPNSNVYWRVPEIFYYENLTALADAAGKLPATSEGWVLRYENGIRIKVKGDEYCRIHRLISRITPLAIWDAMLAGDDMHFWRRQIPEEFWKDFDRIMDILTWKLSCIVMDTVEEAQKCKGLSDKEVGLKYKDNRDMMSLIFGYRKQGWLDNPKVKRNVFMRFRPTANYLEGYEPTSSMARVQEEAI